MGPVASAEPARTDPKTVDLEANTNGKHVGGPTIPPGSSQPDQDCKYDEGYPQNWKRDWANILAGCAAFFVLLCWCVIFFVFKDFAESAPRLSPLAPRLLESWL